MSFEKATVSSVVSDPKRIWRAYSDFELPISTTVPCGPFIISASGGAGGVNIPTDTTSVGVCQLGTSTSTTGNSAVRTFTNILTLAGGSMTFEAGILIPTLSTGVERYIIRAGFGNSATAAHANGVYFEYDEATSPNWILSAANASSRTQTVSSLAVATSKLTLKIVTNVAGTSAEYFVDGVSIGTVATANIPAPDVGKTFGVIIHITKSAGSTSRTVDVDWIEATKTYATPRR